MTASAARTRSSRVSRRSAGSRDPTASPSPSTRPALAGLAYTSVPSQLDPEDRVRVLVGELHDGPLGRDVHAVEVREVHVGDRHRPDREGPTVGHELDEATLGCDRSNRARVCGGTTLAHGGPIVRRIGALAGLA